MNIHIEGNIGAGKSTMLEYLKKNLDCNISQEPVKEWLNLSDGQDNILQKFYNDINRWSFAFQMNCFISRTHQLKQLPKGELNFIERSVYSDKIFALNCYNSGNMNKIEFDIYERWSSWLLNELCEKVDAIIYLRSSPEISAERIKERSRNSESEIPIEYLRELHKLHDEWLINKKDIPVFIVDADTVDYNNKSIADKISGVFNIDTLY